jgi:hypothetical protein
VYVGTVNPPVAGPVSVTVGGAITRDPVERPGFPRTGRHGQSAAVPSLRAMSGKRAFARACAHLCPQRGRDIILDRRRAHHRQPSPPSRAAQPSSRRGGAQPGGGSQKRRLPTSCYGLYGVCAAGSTSFSETLAVGPVRKIGRSARASPASRTDFKSKALRRRSARWRISKASASNVLLRALRGLRGRLDEL